MLFLGNIMIYKASFKTDINLKNKTCVLLISVGQKYHEDKKLVATIDLINRSKFESCHIVIADSLQRYNFVNEPEAYKKSMYLGDKWIQDNQCTINKINMPFKIIRWDYWLHHKDYLNNRQYLESLYNSDFTYKKLTKETIQEFMLRYLKKDPENFKLYKKELEYNCLQYLLEECAIIINIWYKIGYDFIIYPKPITSALKATRDILIKDNNNDKIIWLSLIFKKYDISKLSDYHLNYIQKTIMEEWN